MTETVQDQAARVLAAVRAFPNTTALHIAEQAGLDRFLVGRRLSELKGRKLVERGELIRCPVSDRWALCWIPTETQA